MTTTEAKSIERENGAKHAAKVAEYDVVLVHGLYTITRPDGKQTIIPANLMGDVDILRGLLATAYFCGSAAATREAVAKYSQFLSDRRRENDDDTIPPSQLKYEQDLQDYKDRGLGAASCGDNEGGAR